MLCLMLEKGFSLLRGLCRHKQFQHEEKHRCEQTEPVAFKNKRGGGKHEFCVLDDSFRPCFLCPQNQYSQTIHSLQDFTEYRASLNITVQIKYTLLSVALSCQLSIHPSSTLTKHQGLNLKEKLNKISGLFFCFIFVSDLHLEIYTGTHLWLTKCVPIKMKKVQSLESKNIFNIAI